ncbi:HAD-IIIA family hydrolase [uncultured Alistipes sp.]|uniref:D-glycero-alpha-D-manno-heptose-1,7-bisphosphate 7-phosphatase n=1 Tax=uncultured Alistipes sp. TaxID=538949 RepID=UPI00261D08E9|nr:HAD-IIIA family hydrolase [uncultured Alistipes sp.]
MMEHFDTLFLDRDGVINRLLPGDYVKRWDEFRFLDGALEAFPLLGRCFRRIVVVTNQRGVGRGVMSRSDLDDIHGRMLRSITECGGRIDRIYSCTDTDEESPRRKPRPGMAFEAREDFPDIVFARSVMAGDSPSDMLFGENIGAATVRIGDDPQADFASLYDLARWCLAHPEATSFEKK